MSFFNLNELSMIRTTVRPNDQIVSFNIPKDYVGKEIEIIAFTKEEAIITEDKTGKKKVTFDAGLIDTKGFNFDRDEANER